MLNKIHAAWSLARRHGTRALRDPALLPRLAGRMWRLVRAGELLSLLSRHAVHGSLYGEYPRWVRLYGELDERRRTALRTRAQQLKEPRFSVIMPTRDPDPDTFLAAIASVRDQLYTHWELVVCDDGSPPGLVEASLDRAGITRDRLQYVRHGQPRGIAAATQSALAAAMGDWIAFLDHDDLLAEDALLRIALLLRDRPAVRFVYSDEDKLDDNGRRYWPHFKPDWNGEYLLANNYITHLVACERTLATECGGMREGLDGAQDWDFVLRATERLGPSQIGHLPYVLYHWRSSARSTAGDAEAKPGVPEAQRRVLEAAVARRGWEARVERGRWAWRIRHSLNETPLVSIIIPIRDRADLLRKCVSSLRTRTDYPNVELIVVDNGSTRPDARALLENLRKQNEATVVESPGPFNFSTLCNRGAAAAHGDVLVLLNNDVAPISPDWLQELVTQACRHDVGAVGALLRYPDGRLQHVGIVLGVNGTADHAFRGYPADWSGVNGRCGSVQEVSAVTGACLAVRRDRYLAVGGCDESFAISHNDLDLCLRLHARGWKTLWTPFAELTHHESATRGFGYSEAEQAALAAEAGLFQERWANAVASDPFYNPNLATIGAVFSLAFPPRTGDWPT